MAEHYGYCPREVDALTVRDLAVMLVAAAERRREAWRHTAVLASYTRNLGAHWSRKFRAKAAADLFPWAFGPKEESSFEEISSVIDSIG